MVVFRKLYTIHALVVTSQKEQHCKCIPCNAINSSNNWTLTQPSNCELTKCLCFHSLLAQIFSFMFKISFWLLLQICTFAKLKPLNLWQGNIFMSRVGQFRVSLRCCKVIFMSIRESENQEKEIWEYFSITICGSPICKYLTHADGKSILGRPLQRKNPTCQPLEKNWKLKTDFFFEDMEEVHNDKILFRFSPLLVFPSPSYLPSTTPLLPLPYFYSKH